MREALDVTEPLRDAPMVTNVRHEALLRDARESLARAIENLEAGRPLDDARDRGVGQRGTGARGSRGRAPRLRGSDRQAHDRRCAEADIREVLCGEVNGSESVASRVRASARRRARAPCVFGCVSLLRSTLLLCLQDFDVIVIGAGHAGVEAAWAAAEMGCRVGVCTLSKDTVAQMPCNPAIGGTAKGHLVREIDALGGLMGLAIDATGIQFKLLNRSRGPAVWSPRAQADKRRYGAWVRAKLEGHPRIEWVIGKAGRLRSQKPEARSQKGSGNNRSNNKIWSINLESGESVSASAVIVTTGTFLNGLIHIGPETFPAGRYGRRVRSQPGGVAPRTGLSDGPAQDRDSSAPRPPKHRFRRGSPARRLQARARRRDSRPALLHDRRDCQAAGDVLAGPHHGPGPRARAGQYPPVAPVQRPDPGRRSPVLPVARGQGRPSSLTANATTSSSSPRGLTSTKSTSTASR